MLTLVCYAGNAGALPDDPSLPESDRWSATDAPGVPADPGTTAATLLPEGVLHLSDPDEGHRCVYARYDPLDAAADAVFELRGRVLATGASYGVAFAFIDTRKLLEVVLAEGQVGMYVADGFSGAPFDTTDAFHTYRLIKRGDVDVEVWADGAVLLSVPYEQLLDRPAEFPERQRQVIATSGAEQAEWDIAHACYSIAPGPARRPAPRPPRRVR